jgi:hypothetical protein
MHTHANENRTSAETVTLPAPGRINVKQLFVIAGAVLGLALPLVAQQQAPEEERVRQVEAGPRAAIGTDPALIEGPRAETA